MKRTQDPLRAIRRGRRGRILLAVGLALAGLLLGSGGHQPVWVQAPASQTTAAPPPALPQTPAGRQFYAWLLTFNEADPPKMRKYVEENYSDLFRGGESVETVVGRGLEFRHMTGGFDLRKIEESTKTKIAGLVRERDSDEFARFEMEVAPEKPHRITRMSLRLVPRTGDAGSLRMGQAELLRALDRHLERLARKDGFSGAVLLARDGKPIYTKAAGMADGEKRRPNRLNTAFNLGSMNKMFTAVAILLLAQRGKLKVTDTIGTLLPGYPNKEVAAKVTVHHLLSHTSGLGDIFGKQFEEKRRTLKNIGDYVALYAGQPLRFEPGTAWAYSNYGFLVLGAIIGRTTRTPAWPSAIAGAAQLRGRGRR